MKTKVRIYKPAKNTMQSGRGGHMQKWLMQGIELSPRTPEQLMGWSMAEDTNDQISITFDCKDAAISFAESKGWGYEVYDPGKRTIEPRNYLDNFRYRPIVYQPVHVELKAEEKKLGKPERSTRSGTKVEKKSAEGMEQTKPVKKNKKNASE